MSSWLTMFALTQLFEMPVYWFALGHRPWPQRLAIGFGASALTHPALVFGLAPLLQPYGRIALYTVGEGLVVLVEGLWLKRFGVKRPWTWALIANAFSVGAADVLRMAMR